ncbi:MAG TPA: ZIP family metal transporter [Nitrososphaeraceae archaeon]|nr:ZIP family metal transporter [Nitrososphaeraceae archaeon]
MDYWQLLLLGSIAGFTIFLGLPVAALQHLSIKKKGFLNAFAIGILVFLIIDIFSHAWESASTAASDAFAGKAPVGSALLDLLAMFGGLAIGLLGLVWYESKYMKKPIKEQQQHTLSSSSLSAADDEITLAGTNRMTGGGRGEHQQHLLQQEVTAYRLAMMIAIGIGAHNFSEGLAIGQSYVSGAIGLAILLIIGFGAHNATEGFGIAGPLTGLVKKPRVRFLVLAGLIGGGPTFIGTILGSLWDSSIAYVLFLSLAGGALIYVSLLMYNSGRRQTTNNILMAGIFVGLCAGFLTDLMLVLGGA